MKSSKAAVPALLLSISLIFSGCAAKTVINPETPPPSAAETSISTDSFVTESAAPAAASVEIRPSEPAAPQKDTAPSAKPSAAVKNSAESAHTLKCTISISCASVLNNMDKLDRGKAEIVPRDGVILKETEAEFTDGESIFDVLLSTVKSKGIHMEFVNTLNGISYIEGIGNLYEFDCGALSGWTYKVNGKGANCSSSIYKLKDGDKIEWVYTCDLGNDVGLGVSSLQGG